MSSFLICRENLSIGNSLFIKARLLCNSMLNSWSKAFVQSIEYQNKVDSDLDSWILDLLGDEFSYESYLALKFRSLFSHLIERTRKAGLVCVLRSLILDMSFLTNLWNKWSSIMCDLLEVTLVRMKCKE